MILTQRKCILAPKIKLMRFLYNFILFIAEYLLKIIALFSPKINLFVSGRKTVFDTLSQKIKNNDQTIWFHAASLGEYEQGLPVIEKIKEKETTKPKAVVKPKAVIKPKEKKKAPEKKPVAKAKTKVKVE